MSDKCSFHGNPQDLIDKMNKREQEMTMPKPAYDLFMEQKRLHPDVTMWFNGEHCEVCESPVYTDGKLYWCKKGCENHGKRGKNDKEGFGFISDLIR